MKRIISVECWADKYFVWKLMQNEELIYKAQNKEKAIQYALNKGSSDFCVSIVDRDKKGFYEFCAEKFKRNKIKVEIEYELRLNDWIDIVKIKSSNCFIIQLGPIKFENWIFDFLKERNKTFDWLNTITDLENCCKSQLVTLQNDKNFLELMNFVLTDYKNDENNRVSKLNAILNYLVKLNRGIEKEMLEGLIYS